MKPSDPTPTTAAATKPAPAPRPDRPNTLRPKPLLQWLLERLCMYPAGD